jgi:regulator of protease activity HflC (stomatin/prohibitin superfamily)
MTWLVLTVVLGIATIGGIVYAHGAPLGHKAPALGFAGLAAAIWVVLTVFLSMHTVGQREAGVVYNFSGTIAGDTTKSPGVVMTAPWQHIKTENIGLQKEVFTFGNDNAAVSKDQQPISATLVVNVRIEPKDVIALYKSVGPNWKAILLDGRVPQDFKETTAQFTSPEITLNRPKLRTLTLERLRRELCPKTDEEPFCIGVADVFVQNVGYSQAYTEAIEAKQVQVQEALRAEAKVAQAKAEAQQAVEKAKGEAEAIALRGRALRNNPEVLRLEAIDKLAPEAQVIYCNSGDCPTILGSLNGK